MWVAVAALPVAASAALAAPVVLFSGDPFSCGPFAEQALAALPTAVPAALPEYRFIDGFNECDSGGGKGSQFTLVDSSANGEEVLSSAGCRAIAPGGYLSPRFSCELSGQRITLELEDPNIWVRPASG